MSFLAKTLFLLEYSSCRLEYLQVLLLARFSPPMPSSTVEKLFQLRSQLQQCSNPTAAKVLKSAIKKLEAQLDPGQVQSTKAKSSKIAQRKAALRYSQKQAKQKALQQERTTLKPPSSKKLASKSEGVPQDKKPITLDQEKPFEQDKVD